MADEAKVITVADLIRSTPDHQPTAVVYSAVHHDGLLIKFPPVPHYCDNDLCNDVHYCNAEHHREIVVANWAQNWFITYKCRHCDSERYYFIRGQKIDGRAVLTKMGCHPQLKTPTDGTLLKLLGGHRHDYFKGLRCEHLGMGVAAATYYRRIVEDIRTRLFDAVLAVARSEHAGEEFIARLESAKKETPFSKSVKELRGYIPASLRIDGHDPLLLLHGELSEQLHALSDEECLMNARDIRTLLGHLCKTVGTVLADSRELKDSIKSIVERRGTKKPVDSDN